MKLTIAINHPSIQTVIINNENDIKRFMDDFKSDRTHIHGYNGVSLEGGTELTIDKYNDIIETNGIAVYNESVPGNKESKLFINRKAIQLIKIDE